MKYLISTVITFLLGITPIQQLNADPISVSYLDETIRLQYLTDDQKLLNRFIDQDSYLFSEPLQLTTELLFQPPETESYPEVKWTSRSPLFSNNRLLAGVGLGVSYNLQENWSVYSRYRYLYLRSSQNHGYNGSLKIEAPTDTDSKIHNWSMGTELNLTPKQSLSLIYQGAVQSKESAKSASRHRELGWFWPKNSRNGG